MNPEHARELWIIGHEMERPPFWSPDEGLNSRLGRALRLVQDDKVNPNSDGSYTVVGREGHTYRVREHCSCPDSTYRKERGPCYHEVAVRLYTEWQRRMGQTPQGLPLGPATVEERLAQAVPQTDGARQAAKALGPVPTHVEPPPQEVLMADEAYIPEPDEAPGPVTNGTTAVTTPATSSLDARSLLESMAAWKEQRQILSRYIKEQLCEGIDYYTLRIKGRETKPTLSKAGAEKFLGLMRLQASFAPDLGTWEMLGKPTDQVLYVCTLRTRSGEIVGEGRGARSLKQDGGDANKSIKMSEKSALIDAVLRTGALSEVFTQDLDDDQVAAEPPARTTSADLRSRIWAKVKEAYPHMTSRDACEAYIKDVCGLDLTPDNYPAILAALDDR